MRDQKQSLAEVAGILGVARSTIEGWESGASNDEPVNTCIPDFRIRIPADHYERIYERVRAGEPEAHVAADYRITRPRISQIVQLVEARKRTPEPVATPGFPQKCYRCLTIDPPWPMDKSERMAPTAPAAHKTGFLDHTTIPGPDRPFTKPAGPYLPNPHFIGGTPHVRP